MLFVLAGEAAERIQALRREWDPVMAERIPPHLTLVYPEEVSDEDLLMVRTTEAASRTEPFDLSPGEIGVSNLGGVWFRVVDPSGTWARLRATILTPPFTPYPVIPHITVVHPRTSDRGAEAMAAMDGTRIRGRCQLDEVLYTETSRKRMKILERFPLALAGSARPEDDGAPGV